MCTCGGSFCSALQICPGTPGLDMVRNLHRMVYQPWIDARRVLWKRVLDIFKLVYDKVLQADSGFDP